MREFPLPILLLYLGPPVFRAAWERDASASLAGSVDLWNGLRVAWWAVAACIAVWRLQRSGKRIRAVVAAYGAIAVFSLIWLATVWASIASSPVPLHTLAIAAALSCLLVCALDLGIAIHMGRIHPLAVCEWLLWESVGLLAVVGVAMVVRLDFVGGVWNEFGIRVLGGAVADVPGTSVTVLALSLGLLVVGNGARRASHVLAALLGLAFLLISQTRTAYVCVLALALLVPLMAARQAVGRERLGVVGAGVFSVGALCLLATTLCCWEGGARWCSGIVDFLLRERLSVSSLSGRTGIAEVLAGAAVRNPVGLGYAAGVRHLLSGSTIELARFGVVAERIGNAHSLYLELLAGAGFACLFSFLALVVLAAARMLRSRTSESRLLLVVLAMQVLLGTTSSNAALPFTQSATLLWVLVAIGGLSRVPQPQAGE